MSELQRRLGRRGKSRPRLAGCFSQQNSPDPVPLQRTTGQVHPGRALHGTCVCVSMCVFATCIPGARGDQKMMLEMMSQPLGSWDGAQGLMLLSSTTWALSPGSTAAHDPYKHTERITAYFSISMVHGSRDKPACSTESFRPTRVM